MAPDLVREFVDAFHKELTRQRGAAAAQRSSATRALREVDGKIEKLVDAIASGIRTRSVIEALELAEATKVALVKLVSEPALPAIQLQYAAADRYRAKVVELDSALKDPKLATEVTQLIRSLIDRIVVTNSLAGSEIEVVGDLAEMLSLAASDERKKAAPDGAALSPTELRSVKVVAGARIDLTSDISFPVTVGVKRVHSEQIRSHGLEGAKNAKECMCGDGIRPLLSPSM